MHEAYELSNLLSVALQIEAIAAYDNNLLLGTRQGQLLMYSLSRNKDTNKYEVQILQLAKNFSKRPIQQIEVIPEDNQFLCLTDGVLATYDLKGTNFPLLKTFQESKGASLFALDNKSALSITGESNSVSRLCVAVKRKLHLYQGRNGEFKKHMYDFTVPDVPKAMAWGQQYLCVGFKAEYTLFDLSSSTSNPQELFPTSSSRSLEPTVSKYSETSFLLGRDYGSVVVEEAKEIEIKKTIKWEAPPLGVVWDDPFILGLLQDQVLVKTVEPECFIQTIPELNKARLMYRCKQGLIYVASIGQVWCLSLVDVTKQCQQLLKDKQYQIAMDLTNLSDCSAEEKKQKLHSIQMLHAIELFDSKEYKKSMREFINLNTDPTEVIKLFPDLDNKPADSALGKLAGNDLENALNALIQYLTELRSAIYMTLKKSAATATPAGEKANYLQASGQANDSQASGQANPSQVSAIQDGGRLPVCLDRWVGSQRNVTQLLELIDTTLLKCYLQTNDAFVAPLLRTNNCRLEEAEKTLLHHGKHSELIILYQMKGQHTKALQLLRDQAKQPDSSLKGYHRTKSYLQNLGADHLNLIFKFSDWILKEHPEEGLKIFTEDIAEVENLPRPRILDFLLREHESLVIPYLEHVIYTWNENNPSFHDALITKYREKIIDKKANSTEEELLHTKAKLIAFLEESSSYTPERMILHFPNDSLFEERAVILGRLGRHEQALAIYVQILGDVDRAIRYCETVCEKNKDKNQDVYVTLMRILMNPEQSANLTGPLSNVPRHPKTAIPDLETTLDILEKHADNISAMKALSVLPDSVPLVRLKHFLESALDSQLTLKRRTQVLKGLLYAEHFQVKELKLYHESKSVTITDYNVCPVCKKRFGNQSAFVRYPNGDIVHYSCSVDK